MSSSNNKIDLKGKVAVVTGGSRGIGEAVARHLAAKGVKVVIAARSKPESEKIVAEIKNAGGEAAFVPCDVSKEADQKAVFAYAEKHYGGVDLVFANAGYEGNMDANYEDIPVSAVQAVFDINSVGTIISVQEAIKAFKKRGGGSIVLTSSAGGSFSAHGAKAMSNTAFMVYAATKASIDMIGRSLAFYEKQNIRGYTIAPAVYTTAMALKGSAALNLSLDQLSGLNPIYPGKPGDVKDLTYVVEALFDNSTLYQPGSIVVCDNDVTYSAHEHYKTIELPQSWNIDHSQLKDYQGKPYVAKQ